MELHKNPYITLLLVSRDMFILTFVYPIGLICLLLRDCRDFIIKGAFLFRYVGYSFVNCAWYAFPFEALELFTFFFLQVITGDPIAGR